MGSIHTPEIFLALRSGNAQGVARALGEPPTLPQGHVEACFEIALQKDDDALLAALLKAPLPEHLKDHGCDKALLNKAVGIANIAASKIQLLLDAGCRATSTNEETPTPLRQGPQTPLRQLLRKHHYAAAQPLIDAGGYCPRRHHVEWVSLASVPTGHEDIEQVKAQIDQFLAMGFDINAKGQSRAPLVFAIARNNHAIVAHLVQRGANPHLLDERIIDEKDHASMAYAKAQWDAGQIDLGTPKTGLGAPRRRM